MLTDDELQAIRERCEAATPGPWEGDDANVYTEWSREEYAEERGYNPEGTGFDEIRICEINAYNADISDEEVKANEQFIAHSRTDIPALLAHIDEQVVPLTWTTEPPKESGHYWCRYKGSDKATWSPAYVPAVDDLRSYGMQTDERIEWAGPIPMPKEPTI